MNDSEIAEYFRDSPSYLIVFTEDGTISAISKSFASDLNYSVHDVLDGKKMDDLLTAGSRVFFQTHFFPLIRLHGTYNELFLSFRSSEGKEIPVLMNGRAVEKKGRLCISCGGIRITKRDRYEQEILEAKRAAEKALHENEELLRAKDELQKHQEILEIKLRKLSQTSRQQQEINSVLSHDLQEPLRKITMFSRLLHDDIAQFNVPNADNYTKKVISSAEHMRNLLRSTQQFLSISEKRFNPKEFNLSDAIDNAAEKVLSNAELVKVEKDLHGIGKIYGDPEMIEELFAELFANSLRFRHIRKKELEITVAAEVADENTFRELANKYRYGQFARITVSDNGIGFPEGMSDEVFRLFRKAHVIDEGYGVGLANCRKIVELHHGWIKVNSQVGQGTKFTLLLPLETEALHNV
jgi:phosphoserine phosphatase RsbU/P